MWWKSLHLSTQPFVSSILGLSIVKKAFSETGIPGPDGLTYWDSRKSEKDDGEGVGADFKVLNSLVG